MRPAYTDERGTWHPPGCECCRPPPFELWDDRLKVWIRCAYTALVLVIFCLWIEDDGSGAPAALRQVDSTIVVAVVTGLGGILVAILGDRRMQTEIALTERVAKLEDVVARTVALVGEKQTGDALGLDRRVAELVAENTETVKRVTAVRHLAAVLEKDVRGKTGDALDSGLKGKLAHLDKVVTDLGRRLDEGRESRRGRAGITREPLDSAQPARPARAVAGAARPATAPQASRRVDTDGVVSCQRGAGAVPGRAFWSCLMSPEQRALCGPVALRVQLPPAGFLTLSR